MEIFVKSLKKLVAYNHFKIESLTYVFDIIQPYCWMESLALKDPFCKIPKNLEHEKYFKFR